MTTAEISSFELETTKTCDVCANLRAISRKAKRQALIRRTFVLFFKASLIAYTVGLTAVVFAK